MKSSSTSDPDRLDAKSHGRSKLSSRVKLPAGRRGRDVVLPSVSLGGGGSGGTGGLGGSTGLGMLAGGGHRGSRGVSAVRSGFVARGVSTGFGGGRPGAGLPPGA